MTLIAFVVEQEAGIEELAHLWFKCSHPLRFYAAIFEGQATRKNVGQVVLPPFTGAFTLVSE